MSGQRSELDKHGTQISHPDAVGGSHIGGGSFGGDRRQRDSSMDWMDPEYEVGPNQVVGLNLSTSECHDMVDRFMRTQPEGSRYTMELIPVSAEDSDGSAPVIKGLDK